MTISALPTAPSRSDTPATFISRADAFLAALSTFATEANATAAAMNLNSTNDTSASSVAIGTGAKTFTVTAGKSFQPGMYLVIADAAAPSTNSMWGQVTSYSGTSLVMNIISVVGSGTKSSWVISQSASTLSYSGVTTLTDALNEAVGSSIASAATINLTTATGNLVHVTGTTPITAVTLGAGMRRTVIFDGALTLTHHATNNNLPRAANITTAAGDRATYISDGTTVYCNSYVRAAAAKETIWVPASAMIPRTTNGAAFGTTEFTTAADLVMKTLDFDTATEEGAQFFIAMPKSWNLGTITAMFYWTAASSTGTVAFGLRGGAITNDDPLDTTEVGTGVTASDTLIAVNDLHVSPETTAITIGNTPIADDLTLFEVYRDVANDTLGADAKLIGVKIVYTASADTDA